MSEPGGLSSSLIRASQVRMEAEGLCVGLALVPVEVGGERCGAGTEPEDPVQEAYARGVEDGRAEAAREAHEHLEARERVLNEAVEALRREGEQIAERAEAAVAPLAVGIAGHVLGAEVEAGFQLAEAMAHRSLARLGRAARVVLRVHPEDRSAVEQAIASKDAVAAEQSIEVVADDTVRRGGCLAETDVLSVDARLDSQLQAIAEELGSMNMSGVGDST